MNGTNDERLLSGYYNPEQLAAELKRNKRTLARWRALGEGPPYLRLGREIYYKKSTVAAWVAGLEQDAA